ncbi:hypothetical protein MASR2M66_19940 [Chloroflexota bacterium]
MARTPKLIPDNMLKEEFNYITQTAFQANEDRSRVTSFYLVTVGSFVAAILGTGFDTGQSAISIAFCILFAMLTFMGALTIAQLARLRAAWHESAEAMNQLKEFYIKHHPEIEPAFKWRTTVIPPTNKPYSIANLIAMEVSMLSALTTGAGMYFLLSFLSASNWVTWLIVIISTGLGYLAQWSWYLHLLVDDR